MGRAGAPKSNKRKSRKSPIKTDLGENSHGKNKATPFYNKQMGQGAETSPKPIIINLIVTLFKAF
jgi:hypothetical protein